MAKHSTAERLVALEAKLDLLVQMLGSRDVTRIEASNDQRDTRAGVMHDRAFKRLTPKQHAVLQMLLAGSTDQLVAERFGVSINTAKVYVRSIARKLGVHKRSEIVRALGPLFDAMPADAYRQLSGGLPKTWHADWTEDDPHAYLIARKDE